MSNISELSGRELDAAIEAELEASGVSPPFITRAYSTDGNAMLELIAAMRKRGYRFRATIHATPFCRFSQDAPRGSYVPEWHWSGDGDTLPLAVARAALAALRAGKQGAR